MAFVILRAVKFNHDDAAATHEALNIRKSYAATVNVPEWQHGVSVNPEDSLAAYSARETEGNTLTIQAAFALTDPGGFHQLWIRAVDPAVSISWPKWLVLLYFLLLLILGLPIPVNVLGRVRERSVDFAPDGTSAFVTFELENVLIWGLKFLWFTRTFVGRFDVTWRWQWRHSTGSWNDFELSRHRIYVVLEEPKGPWSQDTTKPHLWPWTDALDYACSWAQGAASSGEAAERITRAVNRHPLQTYTPATMFGFNNYYLGSYLNALGGGAPFVMNCTDCANAVTTLSNLLGCNLWEGRFFNMQTRKFLTLGGNPAVQSAWVSWGWGYHEICWLDAIGQNESIYDGCLQLDMDDNYGDNVHVARLAVAMRFGTNGPEDYRYRLIESGTGDLENIPRRREVL
jgi:hypothetical protein